jgi:rSAM/selenodomain-associated transferase 1
MALARHLVIFARYPRFGTGKSRLAAGAGAGLALRFQRVMLSTLLRRLSGDPRWRTWLAVTPDRSGPWPRHIGIRPQGKGDLGQRMARVAKHMPPGPVVIVGTDSPRLRADHVAHAFGALGNCEAVFGPAMDGGYWMVGLRRRPHFINPFRAVRWSSEHALEDTLANLNGHSVAILDRLDDVDDVEGLARSRHWEMCHAPHHG